MSTPLLDRIAARKVGQYHDCPACSRPLDWTYGIRLDSGAIVHPACRDWSPIPQSPFTRSALAGTLPPKGLDR